MTEQITSLSRLIELAKEKRAVSVRYGMKVKCQPAAWIVNMQGTMIQRMFDSGMYIYEKEKKV